jgi:starch-binding outer membrane protein, SusD/RagB family
LLPNYDDARRQTNEKNKEVLFAVEYTTNLLYDADGNQSHRFYTVQYMTIGGLTLDMAYGEAHVRLKPTDYFFDLYDLKNDSRFYKQFMMTWMCNTTATIPTWTAATAPSSALVGKPKFALGDTALYFTMNTVTDQALIDKKPYTWRPRNKFTNRVYPEYRYHLDPKRAGPSSGIGSLDFELLWLSESYLIAAEAYGRKGNYTKAADLINVVRKRAAYKDGEVKPKQFYEADGGSKADLTKSTETSMMITTDKINSFEKLRDFMLEERAREFAGDDERYFDLARTETFFDRVVKYNKRCNTAVKDWHKLRPIPQNHIDRLQNKGANEEEQNTGYF